jgi:8-amino-7-oxononanoate synthase
MRGIEDKVRKIIVCNGVYPEGGHAAPLRQFSRIACSAAALLYVDDSHGIGILGAGPPMPATPYGTGGGGLLRWLGVRSDRILLAGTLGKALGVPVAFVAGSKRVIDRVRSASKAFVHSSPPSIPNVAAALEALRLQELEGDQRRSRLAGLVRRFQYALRSRGVGATSRGLFPIQTVSYWSVREAQQAARFLQQRGIWPVVQLETLIRPDSGVLRFVITALHTLSEIDRTVDVLAVFNRRNGRGALKDI